MVAKLSNSSPGRRAAAGAAKRLPADVLVRAGPVQAVGCRAPTNELRSQGALTLGAIGWYPQFRDTDDKGLEAKLRSEAFANSTHDADATMRQPRASDPDDGPSEVPKEHDEYPV